MLGSRAPSAAQASSIARWLLRNDLAYLEADGPTPRDVSPRSDSGRTGIAKWATRLNPFWIKLPLPHAEAWVNAAARRVAPLLSRPAVALGFLTMLLAWLVLASRWSQFCSASPQLFHPNNWAWFLLSWVGLKVVHELAHAAACHQQGGTVRESGIVLILFAPLAFVDVTSCWRMNSRWARIAVAAAGMYVELVIAALAILGWGLGR